MIKKYQYWEKQNWDLALGTYIIKSVESLEFKEHYVITRGRYGNPIIELEPDLSIGIPENLVIKDYSGEPVENLEELERIAHVFCHLGPKFDLTTAKKDNLTVEFNQKGFFLIENENWWIHYLVKTNFFTLNYTAFCYKEMTDSIILSNLENLTHFLK